MVSTLLETDIGPFEVLNVRQVLTLCPKLEVTLKVYFKQTVAMAIIKVYFRWAKCDHGHRCWYCMGVHLLVINRKNKYALSIRRFPCGQKKKCNNKQKDLKMKLYLHNTIGDIALTNISRETNHLHHQI